MVLITIVTGTYKPTYILGASHCTQPSEQDVMNGMNSRFRCFMIMGLGYMDIWICVD
jgi:hypothetical protein